MTTLTNSPQSPAMTTESTGHRVSTLVGDRLCIKCGYNLTGQAVLREPHYDMFIVRCSECGTVASVQEHPLLGKWAARWAAALAAAWFICMLLLLVITSLVIWGYTRTTVESASSRYGDHLGNLQNAWVAQNNISSAAAAAQGWPYAGRYTQVQNDWADAQDFDAVFTNAGGWRKAVDWNALWIWPWLALWMFVLGCVWACCLLHWPRKALPVVAIIAGLLAGLCEWLNYSSSFSQMNWTWNYVSSLAELQIGSTVAVMTIGFSIIPLSLGALLGRPVMRGAIRLLLPPRLRGALGFLWIADGKSPPLGIPRRT